MNIITALVLVLLVLALSGGYFGLSSGWHHPFVYSDGVIVIVLVLLIFYLAFR